jgi:geranylgeranyl diphosphate synthase type II
MTARYAKRMDLEFNTQIQKKAMLVNSVLRRLLTQQKQVNKNLKKAISYTLEAPGKRIRSAVVLWCCELICGKINYNAQIAAAAIEMVHTYSLIHDDLPAMDNDDFRRGRPTCHKAFDEATAILTGDALLTLSFETLAKKIKDADTAIRLTAELAQAAGPAGMIAGQMADLQAENTKGTKELLEYIHANKTAKMFRCAAAMGAICGMAHPNEFNRLCEYGFKIGLGFQIADDILDVCSTSKHLGKTVGKDAKAGKATYPSVIGIKKSKLLAKKLTVQAIVALKPFGAKADTLRNLAAALLERTK